jgi:anaerobic ribonucleoside-triphosphate reductase activating protein
MNIAHIEDKSLIYGPGVRFVIWVQGCSIHCKGCWNKEMWSFEKKNEISLDEIISEIKKEINFIEGVTILGGEPFDQYEELFALVKKIKDLDLSIILYTGYTIAELKEKQQTIIFDFVDVLITGRYEVNNRTVEAGLIGSSNQEIMFLTNRYTKNDLPGINESEISIEESGKINIYGYWTNDLQHFV